MNGRSIIGSRPMGAKQLTVLYRGNIIEDNQKREGGRKVFFDGLLW